jgi:hypothetical protein
MTRVHTTTLGPGERRTLLASTDGVLVLAQVRRQLRAGVAWVIVACWLVGPDALARGDAADDVRAAWAEVWSGGAR